MHTCVRTSAVSSSRENFGNPNNPIGYCCHGDSIPCSCHIQLVANYVRASHALQEDLSILIHMFSQKGEHKIMASTSQDGSVWLSRNLVGWGGGGVISFDLCEYPWCVQKWRAHWNMPKYNEDWGTIQKALKSIHNSRNGVTFTNLCTACSGTHSLILHTYTATYVHTYTATHIVPAQLCTYVRTYTYWRLCVNVYERIRACTLVHGNTTPTCT